MPTIPAGYAQVNFQYVGAGAPTGAEVTFGLQVGSGQSAQDIADDVGDAWRTLVLPEQSDEITLSTCLAKLGPSSTGPSAIASFGNTGSKDGEPLTPGIAFLARKNTALGGRAGRGRLFMPGMPETGIDASGIIQNSNATDLQDQLNAFLAALVTLDLNGVVLHGPGSPISEPTLITGITVDSMVASQRRRQRR